jgi:adenosyl cobinamide kinase/adenosyl cobinamide phosphate guanylyltransferase
MILLTGGARSGKSSLAVRLAEEWDGGVTVIATGRATDEEMAERIERHRAERPAIWNVIEEPLDLRGALSRCEDDACVIVDCLTLWVSNLMETDPLDEDIEELSTECAKEAAARSARTIVVTNEVGSAIVPVSPLARRFRDVLGIVNATWAAEAADPFLVVAGKALRLSDDV